MLAKWATEYYTPGIGGWQGVIDDFYTFYLNGGTWFDQHEANNGDWKAIPFPRPAGSEIGPLVYGNGTFVTRQSDYIAESYAFLEWWGQQAERILLNGNGYFVPRVELTDETIGSFYEYWDLYKAEMAVGETYLSTTQSSEYLDVINITINKIAVEGVAVDEAVAFLKAELEKILAKE